jgi:hypothetical protein
MRRLEPDATIEAVDNRRSFSMSEKEKWNREVMRAASLTIALTATLAFGIVVLATGDWVPGTVIVVASLVGLVREVPVIRRLCSSPAPGPPRGTQTS